MNAAKHRRRVPVRRNSRRLWPSLLLLGRRAGAFRRYAPVRPNPRAVQSLGADRDEGSHLAQLEFVIQEARKAADGQWEAWKQADARIQFLLGLAASMVTLGLALGIGRGPASPAVWALLAFAITNLIGAVLYLALAYQGDRFARPRGILPLGSGSASYSPCATRQLALLRLRRAYEGNELALQGKLRRSRRGFLLLAVGGYAGAAALIRRTGRLD